jgi:putative drug exporter of the RND superfamily
MSAAHTRARPDPGDRLATILRRLRWPVVVAWVLIIVLAYPIAHGLSNVTSSNASAYLPSSAPSTKVVLIEQAAQRGAPETDPATVVLSNSRVGHQGGLTATDRTAVAAARAAVARLAAQHAATVGVPGPVHWSADGQAAQFTAQVTAPQNDVTSTDISAVQAIRQAVAGPVAQAAGDGLQAAVTGQAAINADSGITSSVQNVLLLTALLIVAVILLIVYRSPLLWLLPLVGAIAAIDLARAGAHGLANAGLTVSTLSAAILTVLVLGASSDYALLLVHRYRQELRHHRTTEEAMAAALRRTLPTLMASSATVICAMICLLAAQSASLHGLGPVGAVGIAAALLAQVTFLPALLLVCGRPVFWPRIPRPAEPGQPGLPGREPGLPSHEPGRESSHEPGLPSHEPGRDPEESRVWSAVGARVARRPVPVVLAAVLLLGALCAGFAALYTDNNPLAQIKDHPGSVTGAQLLAEHFPGDDTAPLVLLVPPSESKAATAAARTVNDIASITANGTIGGYASYSLTTTVPPYSSAAYTAIANLRRKLDSAAPGSLVGGDPATQYDITQAAGHDTMLIIPLVLVVIAVIIALLLRAVVAPLVLVLTTGLSFAAAFGLSTLLWRYGFGYSGIEAQLPLYIFIFLVALGVDYNIFLAARIREEDRRLGSTRQGTLYGLGVTGGVITAAGLVMAGTFADLARLPSVPVAEVGIAVALGVLLDTLLVRTILVPATLLILGNRAWWPAKAAETEKAPEITPGTAPRHAG